MPSSSLITIGLHFDHPLHHRPSPPYISPTNLRPLSDFSRLPRGEWSRSEELLLHYDDLHAFGSPSGLVKELARRGNALLGRPAVALRPSSMRVEYKVKPDGRGGVMRRVQLTPSSRMVELAEAESLLITPHR